MAIRNRIQSASIALAARSCQRWRLRGVDEMAAGVEEFADVVRAGPTLDRLAIEYAFSK
jgi:hypothetical protein